MPAPVVPLRVSSPRGRATPGAASSAGMAARPAAARASAALAASPRGGLALARPGLADLGGCPALRVTLLFRFRLVARFMRATCDAPKGEARPGGVMAAIVLASKSESDAMTSSSVDALASDTTCFVCRFKDSQALVSSGLARSSNLLSRPLLFGKAAEKAAGILRSQRMSLAFFYSWLFWYSAASEDRRSRTPASPPTASVSRSCIMTLKKGSPTLLPLGPRRKRIK